MTCEQAELRMAELLAGEIAPADRSLLEKHLLDCAACRGDFELARAGARIEWADVPVPKEVIEATLASFRDPAPVVRLLRWATAAAAVFGLAALVIASSRTSPSTEPAAPMAALRPQILATMQDPAVGAMMCKDEEGRPVGELSLKSHDVSVEVLDGIAKTTVEENFENHTDRRLEGTFHFPLPSDASISRLALEVNGKIEEGTCLERERAREVFEGIVRRMQDPALLEWQPGGAFKCRVFPIEPRSTKRVIVAYTQALPCFQGKMTYVYPLASDKTRTHAPEEVRIGVQARFSGALAKIESPSHHLEVQRKNANEATMSFRAAHYRPNNDFVVSMEPGPEEVRVVSHKTDGEDGYFACFATPQGGGERRPATYAFVLDASASTSAPRLEVAKRLVRAMMERRIEGDRFEVIAHHIEVERSGEVDLRAANTFMDRLQPIGGSDVLKALLAAGESEVIYIGKGAPTAGEIETAKILEAVKGRRIRTIAVGSDANGALLERLGGMMRVNPNDDVAKRVAEIAETLGAPVLSDVKIDGGDAVHDVVGVRDLFYGERLVVSGRYRGPGAKLTITGRGYRREVDVAFPAKEEKNNYVRRLWAQRKVADLLAQGPSTKAQVTELGVKYQIMTPYTSFLVLETEQMWKDHQLKREVQQQDEVLGKGDDEKKRMAEAESASQEIVAKRIATMRMAELLQQSYAAWEGRQYERAMKLCGEILKIDPHYQVARELKDGADKERHRTPFQDVMTPKVNQWKAQTQSGSDAVIPQSLTVRFPSWAEWTETVKTFDRSLLPGQTAEEQLKCYDSQRYHEQALMFRFNHQWDKAKAEATKAVETWHENTEARKLLQDVAKDEFRVRVEQANIEITKHVRDGERYLNARMYEQAQKEFENAEFKILNLPQKQKAMSDLLPLIDESISKSRAARILDERRTEDQKRRIGEAEAKAPERVKTPAPPPAPAAKPVMPVEPRPASEQEEWQQMRRKPKMSSRTEELYQVAERRFHAGDFENTDEEVRKALEIDPQDAAARALYTENSFILGKGTATPATPEYDRDMVQGMVRRPYRSQWMQSKAEMVDSGLESSLMQDLEKPDFTRNGNIPELFWMDNGELSAANPWRGYVAFPTHGGINRLTTNVTAPGAPITDALPSTIEPDLSVFLPQAQVDDEDLKKLQIKPRRDAFMKTKFQDDSILEGKRVVLESVQSRQPKGLSEMMEEQSDEDQAIRERLRTARVTVDLPNAPITAIVDHLRKTTGLNIHISGIDNPDAEIVTLKAKNMTVEQALRQVLEPRGKTVQIRDGVVVIRPAASQDAMMSCVALGVDLEVVGVSEDGRRVRLKGQDIARGQICAVTRAGRFVALIVAGDSTEATALKDLADGRILPGDRVQAVTNPSGYLAALPVEVRMDLASRANQKLMRAKMGLKE